MYINIGFLFSFIRIILKVYEKYTKTQINAVVFRKAQSDFGKDKRVTMF